MKGLFSNHILTRLCIIFHIIICSFRAKKRKRILDCDGDTPTGVTSLLESKENHSGLTQEIMALELSQNTPKRMSIHPTPDKRKNPIKGVLKKR